MGNRAVITWDPSEGGIGVYLHWNGGIHSVKGFLEYCKMKEYRTPDCDCYGFARLCQVIGNFFGGTCSVGIDVNSRLDCDNWDNGVYVCKGWDIVGHVYSAPSDDQYDMLELLTDIDNKMPKEEQLGKEVIDGWYKAHEEEIEKNIEFGLEVGRENDATSFDEEEE